MEEVSAPELERLRAWSYRRQLLDRPEIHPAEALREVVAVYSSHPSAPLSLLCRTRSFGAGWLAEAEEEERRVLRLSGPRGSIHLMPVETAPRIFASVRLPLEKFAGNLAYAKIAPDEYARLKERMPELLRTPLTPAEAQEAFGMGANLMTALRVMAYEGLVLRLGGSLRTDVLRYVGTEAWLGHPLEKPDPGESLRWLAMAYLRAFGPARVKDVAWWV
ncbi:MAG TPA: crosslink repair DNA glycosylase YcaQ family protein, partial [Longimicrobium sp.]|nr:crosslink repair DNA glycosylase YcaQ family protein [Longimicrobium sp.]